MTQKELKTLKQYIRRSREQWLEEFTTYLRFPSVSTQADHQDQVQACAEWLADHCEKIGLHTRLVPTHGYPLVLATTRSSWTRPSKPHFLIYGHYDVQPAEPLELWKHPPFEPHRTRKAIYARGASDNKGQHFAHLKAIETFLQTGTELPCEITFLIEGEEEIGSPSFPEVLQKLRNELACDAVVASDTSMPEPGIPAITYALRGVTALEVTFHGPSRDLHSGIFGGCIDNPAMALCQTLAQLRDPEGRITIPGFYDDVVPLSPKERRLLRRIPFNAKELMEFLGVPRLFGEKGYTPWEQRTARPTLEINGLTSGYQGEGTKTIIPAWARAKLSMRLVPNQKARKIQNLVARHLRKLAPKTVRVEITPGHGAEPYYLSPDSPWITTAAQALRAAFQKEPVLLREGGSIPIVPQLHSVLRVPVLLIGLAAPDDNAHSPNEKFDLRHFDAGVRLGLFLWPALSEIAQQSKSSPRRPKK